MTEAVTEAIPHGPEASPSILTLALAFNRLAFESLGGGLAAWSHKMIVEERRWLTEEEYLSTSTICGILPGANQVNMAVFVGNRYRGIAGALAAVFGLIAFPAAAALAIGALYLQFRDVAMVRRFLTGMSCAAAGLAMSVAWRQGTHILTSVPPLALALTTFVASAVFRVPLWMTLAVLVPAGFLWGWRRHDGPPLPPMTALHE